MPTTERYRLTLHSLPGPSPPINRLRAALKCLLRSFRLRCDRVEFLDGKRSDAAEEAHPRTSEAPRSAE